MRTKRIDNTLQEYQSLEEACVGLAKLLGLDAPVPQQVAIAALYNPGYARNLLKSRCPIKLARLLKNPPSLPESLNTTEIGSKELLKEASLAALRWARIRFTQADQETYNRRLRACQECENCVDAPAKALYTIAALGLEDSAKKVCKLCGCFVARKALAASESCPALDPFNSNLTRWGEPRT
jgi:hypothetical protein